MIPVSDVQGLLARPKRLARVMTWQRNRGNHTPPDMIFHSAVLVLSGTPIEGLMVRCRWQPRVPPLPEKYSFGLHCEDRAFGREERIFAYDVDALDVHNLRGFPGMPFDGVQVRGSHRHLWTCQGYGYVEPLDDRLGMAALWELFCAEAGLIGSEFYSPADPTHSGQMSLL